LTQSFSGVVPHRVVLVNAGRDRLVNGRLVRKHQAMLRIRGDKDPVPLDGVTIAVNAVNSLLEYDPSFWHCIPRLRSYSGSDLPPLSAQMVALGNRDLVSAYFDAHGTFSAGRNKQGAAIAILKVATVCRPTLTLTSFTGKTTDRVLPDDSTIRIENIDSGDAVGHDFLLHYKLFVHVPHDVDWPRDTSGCQEIQDTELSGPSEPPITVGPGCSNSNYP
jgi:hypothetical protein